MASISSITSKYASLFVYFTPARLHGILDNWPVGNVSPTLLPPRKTHRTHALTVMFGLEALSQLLMKYRLTSAYLWAYWRPTAGWWEALSSPWGHWTQLLVETHCPASLPAAHKRLPHCPWSKLLNILQSNPDNKNECYTEMFHMFYLQLHHCWSECIMVD